MDRDELREQSLQSWESGAAGWERRGDFIINSTRAVSEWLVEQLDPQPGQTVLELACGPGDTGFMVAERLGPEGRLISSDFSPSMVDVARRRAERRGVKRAEFKVMDAEEMDLGDSSVDAVVCRFGYMLMVDPPQALRETRRVLRQGGPLAFAVWGRPEENPWITIPGMVMVGLGLIELPPQDRPGGIFSLADEAELRSLLQRVGFNDIKVERIPTAFGFSGIEEWIESNSDTAGPMGSALRELPAERSAELKNALAEALASFQTDQGYELPGLAIGVAAS